ncbi:hypothetical protein FMM68_04055 [Lachnospiraceae bacterium MD329]|nr:hypothetical protein [Lachnospiraceae bacterium MD329]
MDYVRAASKSAPIYSIHFLNSNKLDVFVDAVTTELKLSEPKNELAQKVSINLVNCISDGYLLSELINTPDRVFIYANDGEQCREVFRGYIWRKRYENKQKKIIYLTCFDNLKYLQESDSNYYYPSGWKTEDVLRDICSKWGIELIYNYESIEHKKLPLSGKISTMFTDLLDRVKKKTGIKYVIRSAEDIIYIDRYGANAKERIYEINRGENAISTASDQTMEGVVTKVLFTGKTKDSGEVPIVDTLEGDTDRWGTIQKVIQDDTEDEKSDKGEEDKLYENARDEGQYMLDENGKPKETYEAEAINIPWIRKGELVKIGAGDMNYRYIVTSITHNAVTKKMNVDFELADESKL